VPRRGERAIPLFQKEEGIGLELGTGNAGRKVNLVGRGLIEWSCTTGTGGSFECQSNPGIVHPASRTSLSIQRLSETRVRGVKPRSRKRARNYRWRPTPRSSRKQPWSRPRVERTAPEIVAPVARPALLAPIMLAGQPLGAVAVSLGGRSNTVLEADDPARSITAFR
jgi:hypothetical protein